MINNTAETKKTIIFVHGAWHGKWAWDNFISYFSGLGFDCRALDLPGHGENAQDFWFTTVGIGQYVRALKEFAGNFRDPILIGHSMGGLIIQEYLKMNSAKAAIILASVPFNGIPVKTIIKLIKRIFWKFVKVLSLRKLVIGDVQMAREFFYSPTTPPEIVESCYKKLVPESAVASIQISLLPKITFKQPIKPIADIPRLVIRGEHDYFMEGDCQENLAKKWGAQFKSFPGMAHNLMNDSDWVEVADFIRNWIDKNT
jgi:alpha-beta hydrolase superfamily lysophospholipase